MTIKDELSTYPTGSLQPSTPFNDNMQALGALVQLAVEDKDLSADPVTTGSDVGKCWIVATGGSGDWSGHDGDIAICTAANAWSFYDPVEGWFAWVKDEDKLYYHTGSAWAAFGTTIGRHSIPVMASAMTPRNTGGCAALAILAGASGQPDVNYLAFDASSEEHASFAIPMPKSWNEGTVTFIPIWAHPATATNFGVCWKLRAVSLSNDDALATSFGTAQSSVDTGGTTSDLYRGPESSAITIAGTPAAEDVVFYDIYRDPADGGDTMAVDAYLLGVVLYITTDADTDA